MKKKEISILDILPAESIKQVDELGYNFLKERGYNVEGAQESEEKRLQIKKEMDKRGEVLLHSGVIDKDTKAILLWFEIHNKKGEKLATSSGIKFVPNKVEGEDEKK